MQTEQEVITAELVVEQANKPVVSGDAAQELIAVVGPIIARRDQYAVQASKIVVTNAEEANAATALLEAIAKDGKAVTAAIANFKQEANRRWKLWTSFENFFLDPFEACRKSIKGKVISWQEAERIKAEAEQRRLQAKADEEARRERERLEKQAANLKTEEKREAKLEQAAQVIAPTIHVEAPKSAVKMQRRWVAKIVDQRAFIAEAAIRPELMGYVEISVSKLARAKSANGMFECKGVEFNQEIV